MAYSTCNYTDEINENECIGDSLQTINANFSALEFNQCVLKTTFNTLLKTLSSVGAVGTNYSSLSAIFKELPDLILP